MKFTKIVKADFQKLPQDIAEIYANEHLRDFETKVWSAFNDLENDLVMEFKLDGLRPFMEKLQKEVQKFAESLDPKVKAEITRLLTERKDKYK